MFFVLFAVSLGMCPDAEKAGVEKMSDSQKDANPTGQQCNSLNYRCFWLVFTGSCAVVKITSSDR